VKDELHQLNKAFENRIRLGAMSALLANNSMDFNSLKELLGVTDGNLASHLKGLEKAEYIQVEKTFINRKPNTTYRVTPQGKTAFMAHVNALEALLKGL